jgi:hypothetical protein
MTSALNTRVNLLLPTLEREDRVPVLRALNLCDGTVLSFGEELAGQSWDFPELDVQAILDNLLFDVA